MLAFGRTLIYVVEIEIEIEIGSLYVMIPDHVMNSNDYILKAEGNPEFAAVEYELPNYPIQMTEERQKQERRVSQ